MLDMWEKRTHFERLLGSKAGKVEISIPDKTKIQRGGCRTKPKQLLGKRIGTTNEWFKRKCGQRTLRKDWAQGGVHQFEEDAGASSGNIT